jgi:hypothetical protein
LLTRCQDIPIVRRVSLHRLPVCGSDKWIIHTWLGYSSGSPVVWNLLKERED